MIRHFGALIPSTNTTVEIEYNRLLPPSLQVHVGRLGKGVNTVFSPSRNEDIEYQAQMLGTAKVEVVCLAQTSASLSDDDYDAATKQRMTKGAGVPALTSAEAIGQAILALGAKRIALVSPYSQEVIGRAQQYYESRYGLEVVAMEGFSATDAYAIGTLSADRATEAFTRIDRPEIEVLVVPGGQLSNDAVYRRVGAAVPQAGSHHQSGRAVGHDGSDEHQRLSIRPRLPVRRHAGGMKHD